MPRASSRPMPHQPTQRRILGPIPFAVALLVSTNGLHAQVSRVASTGTLKPVTVTEKAEVPEGKDALRATTTGIGKGNQALRDIPQSLTVVTEKLVDDRNLDTLKDVLHNTAGVSFQAAEGGEEDIRLRGFSLATTGDIFVDGMRDPAFYDRDTFNNDRIELLRGSASMLFGRGSTGGAVNQVTKLPRAIDENEVSVTLGSHNYRRIVADINQQTGDNAALRINAMGTKADNNGSGSRLDKQGAALAYRWGIGTADEILVSLYALENNNGINYGLPWIRPTASSPASATTIISALDPSDYFGMASDRNAGTARYATLAHTHRFQDGAELKTQLRSGKYTRDQRASAIRFTSAAATNLTTFFPATSFNRGNNPKIQDLEGTYGQSDFSQKFQAWGLRHEVLAGVDFAREAKNVFRASAITKPRTTVGTPNDGARVAEDARTTSVSSAFSASNLGLYAQDMIHVAPTWKVLGGLRFDSMRADFNNLSDRGVVTSSYQQTISDWSQRAGVLYQPNALQSFHFSYGTSFNTSADTYSYSALSANTPPEQSHNIEFGAKLDSANKRTTTRIAVFRSTKFNERNTDPDSAATAFLLSGQRHTTGLEVDVTGKITPQWEIYGSYMWMPDAVIDVASPTASAGERQGERPSLTPIHSGTVWTTYQFSRALRLGAGLNFRSEQAPNRNPGWMAPAFTTLDVMAEYSFSERYVLKGNITNATNVLYADALYSGHYVPGSGRNVQVTLNIKF